MNARIRFLLKKLQHFPFHSCILEAKFCRIIGLVILNFLGPPAQIRSGPTVMRPLRLSLECSSVHMLLPICAIIHLNDLFIHLIVTKIHQLSNSVFSIEP